MWDFPTILTEGDAKMKRKRTEHEALPRNRPFQAVIPVPIKERYG